MVTRKQEFQSGSEVYHFLRDRGSVFIRMDAIDRAIVSGRARKGLSRVLSLYRSRESLSREDVAAFHRALAGWIVGAGAEVIGDERIVYPVAQSCSPDPGYHQCLQVLLMVAELHKAGYQRLRIAPGMSGSGFYWRCSITPSDNVGLNGWEPIEFGPNVVTYTSAAEDQYFGWTDTYGKTARQLAACFIERFPDVARRGIGRDRAYAGWFVEMLGAAENGRLPIFFGDWEIELAESVIPPPPVGVTSTGQ
ncbi:hypothetical protein [Paraburkholderia youngii]|uniref:hypothetical protein n=1 Tax=Paraburkholderia youngii TaxID=2782701 RepID=UPI003D1DD4D0